MDPQSVADQQNQENFDTDAIGLEPDGADTTEQNVSDDDLSPEDLSQLRARTQKKIESVTAENLQLRDNLSNMQGQFSALQNQVSNLTNQSQQPQQEQPQGLHAYSDAQLKEIVHNEEHEHLHGEAQDILVDRRVQRIVDNKLSTQNQQSLSARSNQFVNDISNEFGDDSQNPGSELYKKADEIYKGMVQKYGEDVLAANPLALHTCFSRAQMELNPMEQNNNQRQQVDRTQRIEGQNRSAVQQSNSLSSAVSKARKNGGFTRSSQGQGNGSLRQALKGSKVVSSMIDKLKSNVQQF